MQSKQLARSDITARPSIQQAMGGAERTRDMQCRGVSYMGLPEMQGRPAAPPHAHFLSTAAGPSSS